jgi:hypothetical protein
MELKMGITGIESGFTITPAVRCTAKVKVELRLSIKNSTGKSVRAKTIFYLDGQSGLKDSILAASNEIEIADGTQELISEFFSTEKYIGKRKITAEVLIDNGSSGESTQDLHIIPCETRALPLIDVAWIEPWCYTFGKDGKKATAEDVSEYVRLLTSVGIHSAIITYTELIMYKIGAFFNTDSEEIKSFPAPLEFDFLDAFMNEADKQNMNVFVGLGRGNDLMLTWEGFEDTARIQKQIDFGLMISKELWKNYSHHKSFYGWYLAHEADDLPRAGRYYNPVADILHSYAKDKPVMIAPSGTPIVDANTLNTAKYDIVAYQDAVGSGYMPYVNTWDQEKRIAMLHSCYKRYADAHIGTNKHIWTDLEIWKMDGPTYANGYASPYHQVARQIEIERIYTDCISCYSFPGMFQDENASFKYLSKGAYELYEDYKAYFEKVRNIYKI